MKLRVTRRSKFSNLHPQTQKTLRRLTVSGWNLRYYIDTCPDALLVNIAYHKGRIVGWMAVLNKQPMFYVRPDFRRRGVGTALAGCVNRKIHRSEVGIKGSEKFFKRCGIKTKY